MCLWGKEGSLYPLKNRKKKLFCTTFGASRCEKRNLWVTLKLFVHLPVLNPNMWSFGNTHSPVCAHILPATSLSWLCCRAMSLESIFHTQPHFFLSFFPRKLSEPVMSVNISESKSWLQNSSLSLGFAQIEAKAFVVHWNSLFFEQR